MQKAERTWANPQANHTDGRRARGKIQAARESIADTLGVSDSEIMFVSGATEANSWVRYGLAKDCAFYALETEHNSLISNLPEKSKIPVNAGGQVNREKIPKEDKGVYSSALVNNEIGTIQDTKEIRQTLGKNSLLHTDASQAARVVDISPEPLAVDAMTVNAHKVYGPKGIALLWIRAGTKLFSPWAGADDYVVGDYQKLRPGTLPTQLIVGFAEALEQAQANHKKRFKQANQLREYLLHLLDSEIDFRVHGDTANHTPHILSLSVTEVDHEYLATKLDQAGFSVATGSACQSDPGKSPVLKALDTDSGAIRISFGKQTTYAEINAFADAIVDKVTD
jgi:cysteine desulfurase